LHSACPARQSDADEQCSGNDMCACGGAGAQPPVRADARQASLLFVYRCAFRPWVRARRSTGTLGPTSSALTWQRNQNRHFSGDGGSLRWNSGTATTSILMGQGSSTSRRTALAPFDSERSKWDSTVERIREPTKGASNSRSRDTTMPTPVPVAVGWNSAIVGSTVRSCFIVETSRGSRQSALEPVSGRTLTRASSPRLQPYRLQYPRRFAPRPRLKRDV
jgi:hypothetical protein